MALNTVSQGILSFVADNGLVANASRITDEELSRLAREGRLPIDFLVGPGAPQPLGQRVPGVPFHDHAEMRHGHIVPVHFVVVHVWLPCRIQVRDNLVTEEIEVHPFVAAAPFGAAEQITVETARCPQVMNRNGEVERLRHPSSDLREQLRGGREQDDCDAERTCAFLDHDPLLLTCPPFVPRLHREIRMVGKETRDPRIQQRVDLLSQIAPGCRIARRS
jgi:hypothetical protein